MKFIEAINAMNDNVWAAFILIAGVIMGAFSVGHPDLKELAATVIGGALIMFRTHSASPPQKPTSPQGGA